MFWHHPWCLRAGQKFKKVDQKSKKIKCFSEAPESYLKSFRSRIKFRALFSHRFMHFIIFPIFHIFPIFPLFISDIFNPEGCRSPHTWRCLYPFFCAWFHEAISVGAEEGEEPSASDYLMHVFTLFWKLLFSYLSLP